jgi:hypothetical protein
MSTLKTTFIQHPSATEPSIELSADGSIVLPLSGIGDLADVDEGSGAADGDVLTYDGVGNVWSPVAPAAGAPLYFVENVQTENYTLVLSDVAKVIAMNNSAAATVTVPLNSSVAFSTGTVINVYAMTAETVTIAGAEGVTVRNDGDIADQYVEVSLRKRDTDEWVLSGDVS